jgi:hypothetical protein
MKRTSLWLLDGSLNRVSSIPIPPFPLPTVIRDLKTPREPALPARSHQDTSPYRRHK